MHIFWRYRAQNAEYMRDQYSSNGNITVNFQAQQGQEEEVDEDDDIESENASGGGSSTSTTSCSSRGVIDRSSGNSTNNP